MLTLSSSVQKKKGIPFAKGFWDKLRSAGGWLLPGEISVSQDGLEPVRAVEVDGTAAGELPCRFIIRAKIPLLSSKDSLDQLQKDTRQLMEACH